MSLKAKIEAVLFMTDKPLRAQAIAVIIGEDVQVVRQTLLELIHDYEERQGGLEIADEDGYSFQVRDQFANLMDQFMPIEMSAAQLRTLSAIAIKQPIPQSEIIRIRGGGAYEHIKELASRGLVMKREDENSRSPLLSTTKQFQDYFRLTKDGKSLRQYLKRQMKKKDKEDLARIAFANLEDDADFSATSPDSEYIPAATNPEAGTIPSTNSDTISSTISSILTPEAGESTRDFQVEQAHQLQESTDISLREQIEPGAPISHNQKEISQPEQVAIDNMRVESSASIG